MLMPINPVSLLLRKRPRGFENQNEPPRKRVKKKLTIRKSSFKHSFQSKTWTSYPSKVLTVPTTTVSKPKKNLLKADSGGKQNLPKPARKAFAEKVLNGRQACTVPISTKKKTQRPRRSRKQRMLKPKLVYHSSAFNKVSLFEMRPSEYQWLGWVKNMDKPVVDDGDEKTCAEKLNAHCKQKGLDLVNPQLLNPDSAQKTHIVREKKTVTKVLRERMNSLTGEREFFVKWSGKDETKSWEPEIALSNCDALKRYQQAIRKLTAKSKKAKKARVPVKQKAKSAVKMVSALSLCANKVVQIVNDQQAKEKLKVGDQVECSSDGKSWRNGFVTGIDSDICVRCVGFKHSHVFNQVRRASFSPDSSVRLDIFDECQPYFEEDQQIFALSTTNVWRQGRIIDSSRTEILLKYTGFSDRFNEFFPRASPRINRGSFLLPETPNEEECAFEGNDAKILKLQQEQAERLSQIVQLMAQQEALTAQRETLQSLLSDDFFLQEEMSFIEEKFCPLLLEIVEKTDAFLTTQLSIQDLVEALISSKTSSESVFTTKVLKATLKFCDSSKPTKSEMNAKRALIFQALQTSNAWLTQFLLNELAIVSLQTKAEIYERTAHVSASPIELLSD